ncbi:MAG: thrombospondin type 3 repeat-containing protein, partial [Pseudomonadota bacterium]
PSRGQCLACHSNASGRTLGPEIAQLNHDLDYGAHGVGNQLSVLDAMGLIEGGLPGPVETLDALPYYSDESAPVADRARGYLHANCAMCHRPGGPGIGPEDFRYYVSGPEVNALDVTPWRGDLGVPGALLLKRGLPEESVLWLRLSNDSFFRMPPLGVSIVDAEGVALIGEWIKSGSGFGFPDTDSDEYSDDLDNCSQVANKAQRDTDGDGFGNLCDPDLNNDNVVNVIDLGLFRQRFFSSDPDADFDGDGVVNVVDLGIMRSYFFAAPGPGATSL